MRTFSFSLLLFLALTLTTLITAWTKEDHEIFRLNDEILATEGPSTTFYTFIGVPPTADLDTITKQLRKRSKQLHPDKAVPSILAKLSAPRPSKPGNKKPGVRVQKGPSHKERAKIIADATERYARFGVVADVLKGPARERYDHFLRNGFPRWRGTGYYYRRFRPGLVSVLVGLLVVVGGGAHYGALYMSWKRQREFVQRYVGHARRTAWGNDSGIPGLTTELGQVGIAPAGTPTPTLEGMHEAAMPTNRRQKRAQEQESRRKDKAKGAVKAARANGVSRPVDAEVIQGPQGSKKRVVAENGKVLIVDSVGNVYLEETTVEGQVHEFLLDPDEIPMPTIRQTALYRIPIWAYAKTAGRLLNKRASAQDESMQEGWEHVRDPEEKSATDDVIQSARAPNAYSESRKRKAVAR